MFKHFFRNNQDLDKTWANTDVSLHKLNYQNQSQSLYENFCSDKIPLHMTNMIVKTRRGCTILTLDLQLQTTITMNIIPVIIEKVQDQLLLIEILHIVTLCLHTKETNHQT